MDQLTYLVAFLVLIALIAVVPAVVRRWHVPAVVAIMAVGILIGPHGVGLLGWIADIIPSSVDAQALRNVVDAFGFLGLVFLMALAGAETDLRMLANEKRAVTSLSILTFALPAAAGYFVYWLFDRTHPISAWVYASLFASHSIGIVFPVIREMGLVRTRFGIAVLSSTVITDILSLVLLAVCVQWQSLQLGSEQALIQSISLLDRIDLTWLGAWFTPAFLLLITLFVLAVLLLVPLLWRLVEKVLPSGDETKVTFFLLVVLAIVLAGEMLGVNLIVGAFVAGMAVARTPGFRKAGEDIHHKLETIGFGLVIPFLFLSVGFHADLRVFFGLGDNGNMTRSLLIAGATVLGLVLSKVISGWLALRLSGFGNRQGLCAGLMTVPQLSATLAAAVALNLKLLDETFFNAIVVLSLATTLPVPTLVRLLIARSGVAFDHQERGGAAIKEADTVAELEHLDLTV